MKNLKRHKSLDIDQIPADLIKAGGRTLHSEIQKLINSVMKKEEMPGEWKWWIIVPIHKKGDTTDCSNDKAYHFGQLHEKFYSASCCLREHGLD
jgi:hypothetical protein